MPGWSARHSTRPKPGPPKRSSPMGRSARADAAASVQLKAAFDLSDGIHRPSQAAPADGAQAYGGRSGIGTSVHGAAEGTFCRSERGLFETHLGPLAGLGRGGNVEFHVGG